MQRAEQNGRQRLSGFHSTSLPQVGQRTVRVACRTETPSPDQSETLLLRQAAAGYPEVDEYVRIESVDSRTTQTFTDASGDYQRDVLVMTILAPLRNELAGIEVPPRLSTSAAPTQIRRTQVADAARYYSVQPLEAVAEPGDLSVSVASPCWPTGLSPAGDHPAPVAPCRARFRT